jgi:hypothetical protein
MVLQQTSLHYFNLDRGVHQHRESLGNRGRPVPSIHRFHTRQGKVFLASQAIFKRLLMLSVISSAEAGFGR